MKYSVSSLVSLLTLGLASSSSLAAESRPAVCLAGEVGGVIDKSLVTNYSGKGYVLKGRFSEAIPDTAVNFEASTLKLFEGSKQIGPNHRNQETIAIKAAGRYSHYREPGMLSRIYFSASDSGNVLRNGRTYTYCVPLSGIAGTASPSPAPSVSPRPSPVPTVTSAPSPTPSPVVTVPSSDVAIGYANMDGKTTGGAGGKTVVVTSFEALKSAATSTEPTIHHVSGAIRGSGQILVKSNKTILGLKGSSLTGAALSIFGVSNVIVRNMTIVDVVGYSNITVRDSAHHVWIDHCELSSKLLSDWEYYDGLVDVGRGSTYVTLSWNRLHDNHIPMLIGFGDTSTGDSVMKVTVHNNYFYNTTERHPRIRFGTIHFFNNYVNGGSYGLSSSMGATVRTDNNYFENVNIPIWTDVNGTAPGYITGASTNVYKGGGANKITTSAGNWDAPYSYKSNLIPANDVPAVLMRDTGPSY